MVNYNEMKFEVDNILHLENIFKGEGIEYSRKSIKENLIKSVKHIMENNKIDLDEILSFVAHVISDNIVLDILVTVVYTDNYRDTINIIIEQQIKNLDLNGL